MGNNASDNINNGLILGNVCQYNNISDNQVNDNDGVGINLWKTKFNYAFLIN